MIKIVAKKLSDIAEITMGQSPRSEYYNSNEEGMPFLQGNRTFGDKYPNFDTYTTNPTKIANVNDVIMSVRAPVGDLNITPKKICLGRGVCSIHMKNGNQDFLYYLMKYYVKDILNRECGTVFGSVNKNDISSLIVKIPERFEEQKKISSILSVLDDKIELNKKINRNLEAQAQAIFKSWFIDFEPFKNSKFIDSELGKIPEGWKVGKLSDIANITMGQSPNGNSYNEKKIGMIFFQGRAEFGWRFPRNRLYTTAPKRIAERDSVLLSIRAPVGDINKALERCCIGRGLASLTSNHKTFLYYKMQSIRHLLDVYNGEGTVFGSINKNTLQEIRTIIPIDSEIIRFELKLKVVDELIRNNYIENLRLIKLRDTLLPELMSGKIDILRFSNR